MGEMLIASKGQMNKGRPGPGRGKAGVKTEPALNEPPTLAALGIDKIETRKKCLIHAVGIPYVVYRHAKDDK